VTLTPHEQFEWAQSVSQKGSSEHEAVMRSAISKAYYAVLFQLRDAVESEGVSAYWGRHEVMINFLTVTGPKVVPSEFRKTVELLCGKLDEMRVRRGDADYDLSLSKGAIVGALGAQINDGKKILPLAEPMGVLLAKKLNRSSWPR
jgi:hypothetical protein